MSSTEILEELRRMPELERRELVEAIAMEFGDFNDELSPEQIAELERRAAAARAHPELCRPMEDVFADIEKRLRAKQ
jgi:putative addiction module component (TIGR02574 family)